MALNSASRAPQSGALERLAQTLDFRDEALSGRVNSGISERDLDVLDSLFLRFHGNRQMGVVSPCIWELPWLVALKRNAPPSSGPMRTPRRIAGSLASPTARTSFEPGCRRCLNGNRSRTRMKLLNLNNFRLSDRDRINLYCNSRWERSDTTYGTSIEAVRSTCCFAKAFPGVVMQPPGNSHTATTPNTLNGVASVKVPHEIKLQRNRWICLCVSGPDSIHRTNVESPSTEPFNPTPNCPQISPFNVSTDSHTGRITPNDKRSARLPRRRKKITSPTDRQRRNGMARAHDKYHRTEKRYKGETNTHRSSIRNLTPFGNGQPHAFV
jgi:hypothetical protein